MPFKNMDGNEGKLEDRKLQGHERKIMREKVYFSLSCSDGVRKLQAPFIG